MYMTYSTKRALCIVKPNCLLIDTIVPKGHRDLNFQAHLPTDKGLGNSIRVPKPFTFKMKLQSKCKTVRVKMSSVCMRKKVHFQP